MKVLHKYWSIILIVVLGLFLRLYKFDELFMYSHDQDLAGWFIRDVIENKHIRLIGQETTNKGVFIGPLWYYSLIPFYLLFNGDPIGGVFLALLIGAAAIGSIYFVFNKIWDKRVGIVGSIIYAVSFYTVFTDREVVPTTPAMLWTIWYLYAIWLLYKGKQKWGFILAGLLLALVWHINLALALLAPLLFFALFLSRKKINLKFALFGIVIVFVLSLPLLLFELRHDYQQTNAIVASLTTDKTYTEGTSRGIAKLDRLMQLVYKNTDSLFVSPFDFLPQKLTFWILLGLSAILVIKKKLDFKLALLMTVWMGLFVTFFTLNPINLSEYYLNGMNIVWIAIVSLFLAKFINKWFLAILLGIFIIANISQIINVSVNKSGYIERKQVIEFIKTDAKENGYPCVAISYITEPGFELGYRYLIYQVKLHANQPKSGSPVYTIVFPHSKVDRIDRSFGALGLVLPDYARYNKDQVEQSCKGENANLTDPLFGFTN